MEFLGRAIASFLLVLLMVGGVVSTWPDVRRGMANFLAVVAAVCVGYALAKYEDNE